MGLVPDDRPLSAGQIRKCWERALGWSRRGSLSRRLAGAMCDELEAAGVTEADLDRAMEGENAPAVTSVVPASHLPEYRKWYADYIRSEPDTVWSSPLPPGVPMRAFAALKGLPDPGKEAVKEAYKEWLGELNGLRNLNGGKLMDHRGGSVDTILWFNSGLTPAEAAAVWDGGAAWRADYQAKLAAGAVEPPNDGGYW